MRELIPVGDLIIVTRLDSEKTRNGLILPIPNQKSIGRIEAVGRGLMNKRSGKINNFNFEVGDLVIFQTHRGHTATYKNENYLFLGMEYIICVYKNSDLVDGKPINNISVEEVHNNSFLSGGV